MAGVVLISTTIVQPKNIKQSNIVKIHLNPFDFSFFRLDYPKMGFIFPKPDQEIDTISQLTISLSLALEIFYPLVGRVAKIENEDETTSFFINCDGSNGVKFVHAKAENITVRDVIEPEDGFVPYFMKYFFSGHELKSYKGISNPLFVVQITELKDGIFLGWSVNHLVADGFSVLEFLHTWSKICSKGLSSITNENFAPIRPKEWFLDNIDYPIHIPNSEINVFSSQDVPPSPFLREKIFRFTKQQILKLKAKANEEIISSTHVKVSSFQTVLGYLWRSIIKQSCINREREVRFMFAVGLRQRINPGFDGKECFGNMATVGIATTTAGEIREQGIGQAALRINENVGFQSKESINIFAESWMKNIKIPNLGVENGMDCDTLVVAGSQHYNVYGINFGWGKTVALRSGSGNVWNGKIMVFPGDEEGSIDVQTCLPTDMFAKLSGDEDFLENVNIL